MIIIAEGLALLPMTPGSLKLDSCGPQKVICEVRRLNGMIPDWGVRVKTDMSIPSQTKSVYIQTFARLSDNWYVYFQVFVRSQTFRAFMSRFSCVVLCFQTCIQLSLDISTVRLGLNLGYWRIFHCIGKLNWIASLVMSGFKSCKNLARWFKTCMILARILQEKWKNYAFPCKISCKILNFLITRANNSYCGHDTLSTNQSMLDK